MTIGKGSMTNGIAPIAGELLRLEEIHRRVRLIGEQNDCWPKLSSS